MRIGLRSIAANSPGPIMFRVAASSGLCSVMTSLRLITSSNGV
jgi:hypothetical protein